MSPTTNVVERANSQAKLIMTDKCERLAPETLGMLMIVKHKKSLWHSDFRDPDVEPEDSDEEDDDA